MDQIPTELKTWLGAVGGGGALIWLAKAVGQKLVDRYFEQMKQAEEARDENLHQKINWLNQSVNELKMVVEAFRNDMLATKMKIQSFEHQISGAEKSIVNGVNSVGKVIPKFIEITKGINARIEIQDRSIKELGSVIMKINKGG